MAETVLEYKISYENGATFKAQKQLNGGGYSTLIETDENGHISDVWTYVQDLVEKNISKDMDAIGVIMKSG